MDSAGTIAWRALDETPEDVARYRHLLRDGGYRRRTVLGELGRLGEPTLIRRAAEEICKHELKCDEALRYLRDRRRRLKEHAAENGKTAAEPRAPG